jgi:hypothetical protein
VARCWTVVWGSGCAVVSLSDSEAARLTVTTEEDEMDVFRDEVRRCLWAASGCCSGSAAGLLCIFMLALWRVSGAGHDGGSCLRN